MTVMYNEGGKGIAHAGGMSSSLTTEDGSGQSKFGITRQESCSPTGLAGRSSIISKSVIEGASVEHARRGMGTRRTEHAGLGGLKVGGEGGL